ncbi:hypothetical protein B0T16DRAFT_494708 [Cercophora newfieldiana]|uniref:Uncharacterized protein n=1 Tax=Cercophora newfieldiana TaxID=92897 RepID=A0AA40CMD4_9PEZI|nr:hypothetical protein B0T16DRAFT_494708 [Cercophora newfieldiana]
MASGYLYSRGQSTPNSEIVEIPFQTLPPTRPDTKGQTPEAYDSGAFQSPLLRTSGSPERHHGWGWPRMPRPLRRGAWETVFSLVGDIILLCAWLAVAAFAIGIARSGGVPRSDMLLSENLLSQARIIAPTLFPILFAATVGRCLRLISMYRVEQGERLGVLDQLHGSQSFVGTLITAATLRGATFLTIALIVMWSLSPLGGQASFRSFYWQGNMTETPVTYPYLSINNTNNVVAPTSDRVIRLAQANALFSAVLVGTRESTDSPMDVWGNVKIPSLAAVAKTRQSDAEGWFHIGTDGVDTPAYSSLIGVPVGMGQATNASTRFSFETSYWTLDCPWLGKFGDRLIKNISEVMPYNYSSTGSGISVWTDRHLGIGSEGSSEWPNKPRRVGFRIDDWDSMFIDCNLQTAYVETEVTCQKTTCGANRIRESKQTHPSPNITTLDYEGPPMSPYFLNIIVAVPGRNARPSGLSGYIDKTLFGVPSNEGEGLNKSIADIRGYEALLAQALNTYWLANIGADWIIGQRSGNYSTGAQSAQGETVIFEEATGTIWTEEPIFTYSKAWLSLLFISVLVALGACVANVVLSSYLVRSPHLLMNFTTMARDSPFVQAPPGGSALSDFDRSNMMRHARVRYGDVAAGEPVGHIAIGTIDGRRGGVAPLDKSRMYD